MTQTYTHLLYSYPNLPLGQINYIPYSSLDISYNFLPLSLQSSHCNMRKTDNKQQYHHKYHVICCHILLPHPRQ